MSRLLAVAARELRERWLLLPGAFVGGFFPLLLPAFGVPREDAPLVGAAGAVGFGLAAAVIMGSSMLARDASNGRLGFLLSRPLPWGAIWGGKWLAAIALAVACALLTAIPWMAAYPLTALGGRHGESWLRALWESEGAAVFAVVLLLAIGLSNFNGVAFRSRSPWLAADLVLVLLAGWTARRTVAPLAAGVLGTHTVSRWGLMAPLGVLAAALFVASAVQLARGRTDLRRAHLAMSATFWVIVFGALGLAGARVAWARAARPSDVVAEYATSDAAGRWVYVAGGSRRGGWPGFLIDSASGRFVPLGLALRPLSSALDFPDVGSAAARLTTPADSSAMTLFDLAGPAPRARTVVFESSPPSDWWSSFDLSPSGRLAFLVHEHGASLYAVPSGSRVATTTLAPGWRPASTCFLSEDRARVWLVQSPWVGAKGRRLVQVVDLAADGETRATIAELAPAPSAGGWPAVLPDARGERMLTDSGALQLRDGAAGALIATLEDAPSRRSAAFLGDGRIVVADVTRARARLRVFASDGTGSGEIPLGPEARLPPLRVGPEVTPGRVAVGFGQSAPEAGATLIVDVARGVVAERLDGLWPARASVGPHPVPRPGTVHLFVGGGRLVRIDFATGERTVVAGPGAPAGERISVR